MYLATLQNLHKLVIYGKRKSIALVVWELRELLKSFPNMVMFGLGTSGPRFRTLLSEHDPSPEQVLHCSMDVLGSWHHLQELYFIGVSLREELGDLLEAVHCPLRRITLHSCGLVREDVQYLVGSKHCGSVVELGLQFNKLTRMASELCELSLNARHLKRLDLKETLLEVEEKIAVLSALSMCSQIEALYLYENEDMLTVLEYHHWWKWPVRCPHCSTSMSFLLTLSHLRFYCVRRLCLNVRRF